MKTKKNTKVSIIIPCFNQGEFLEACLNSLKNQTLQPFEVLIVNDGSTETKTLKILNALAKNPSKFGRFQIFHKTNGGLASARNYGLKHAKGDWIIPLDADDKLASTFIEKTLAFAEEKNLDFVVTWIQHFGLKKTRYKTKVSPFLERFNNFLPYGALFHRRIFDEAKYDETFKNGFEDWELWIRILKNNFQGDVLKEPLFLYQKRANSMLTRSRKKYLTIVFKIWSKNYLDLKTFSCRCKRRFQKNNPEKAKKTKNANP